MHGASFTFLGIGLRTVATIGSMAVLARLLTPADFGHIAMATVVTELAALFSNFGFGSILIQRARLSRLQMDTMFWAAVVLGLALSVLVWGLSFASQAMFGSPLVGELLRVLCVVFVLEELTVVPRSLLSRLMMFRADFVVQAVMVLLRAGLAIAMAVHGFGVWSLVAGSVAGALAQSLLYLYFGGYWPRLRFSWVFLRSTWRTNGSYFGTGVLYYINSNLDLFLIGRMLGATALGIYQNARSLTQEINVRMAQPLQRVLFPALAQVQNEPERFREGVMRSSRLLAVALTPVAFGLAAVAEEIVPLLYGAQWLGMIPVLKVIAIGAGLGMVATITGAIFNAKNRVDLSLKMYLVNTVVNVVVILAASHWGMMGIVYAKMLLSVLNLVFFRIALSLVGMGARHVVHMMLMPCASALAMLLLIAFARPWVHQLFESLALRLTVLVSIGVLSYGALVLLLARAHAADARGVLTMLLGRRARR